MDHLSDAQVLLLAAQLTATPDLLKLRPLAASRTDVLLPSILYRLLLTYLPLDVDEEVGEQLVAFLTDLEHDFADFSVLDAAGSLDDPVNELDVADAEEALSALTLDKIPIYNPQQDADPLSDFLIAWVHKVEEFSGLPSSILTLIDQFAEHHDILRLWADTYLRPLSRLQNDFYANEAHALSLRDIETIQGKQGVATLLGFAAQAGSSSNITRDLKEIVTPWVNGCKASKRRKLSTPEKKEDDKERATTWQDVNEWLLATSQKDYDLAATAIETWDGPASVEPEAVSSDQNGTTLDDKLPYIRTVFALIYTCYETEDDMRTRRKQDLLRRAASLAQLMPPDFSVRFPDVPDTTRLQSASRSDLLANLLLSPQNQLTRPSSDNVDFLHGVLSTQALLSGWKIETTTKAIASTALFDSPDKQKDELRSILNQVPRLTRSNVSWSETRTQLRWLHTWSSTGRPSFDQPTLAFLGRLEAQYLESELLNAMLAATDFRSIKDMYLSDKQVDISKDRILDQIVAAILSAYDNASNGNRTRGGVKKASDLITAFRNSFEDGSQFDHIEHLIKATHSLSFYHLTLQYGVPFQPVSIRASSDPLSLIEKVLDQNNNAYAKLDDLLSIARNMVLADLPTPFPQDLVPNEAVPIDRRLFDAEHRITYSAIKAALADNDFDTAYSLITTRLDISSSRVVDTTFADDTSWRAAYAAGKYRPYQSYPFNIHNQISSLQKRMEMLSTALTLAPTSEPLPEILATWRRLEEELDSLKNQALQEERALDAQTDQSLPGGFGPSDRDLDANETKRLLDSRRSHNTTGPSYEEEAPMGLFDVARGVGTALGRHAFPLRGKQGQNVKVGAPQPRTSTEGSRTSQEISRPGSADGQQRVRKRDMLSNAVTGGLVSGMSWVLGAPAANTQQRQEHG
ncbi:hypothetical protein LTR05_002873 [Lithohypha guttulata]|uniref:Sec39 domain-containing protein n=1 Tax=Lithohypha guttulata TaxID=1690604 RepID=A0AAN7T502_9EURO|nr:hypothetical protein LTR05_002873 [Lithohypha guttulata]